MLSITTDHLIVIMNRIKIDRDSRRHRRAPTNRNFTNQQPKKKKLMETEVI